MSKPNWALFDALSGGPGMCPPDLILREVLAKCEILSAGETLSTRDLADELLPPFINQGDFEALARWERGAYQARTTLFRVLNGNGFKSLAQDAGIVTYRVEVNMFRRRARRAYWHVPTAEPEVSSRGALMDLLGYCEKFRDFIPDVLVTAAEEARRLNPK